MTAYVRVNKNKFYFFLSPLRFVVSCRFSFFTLDCFSFYFIVLGFCFLTPADPGA